MSHSTASSSAAHQDLETKDRLDRFGALLGFICAIHCALTPLSMVLVPLFGFGALWTTQGEFVLLSLALLFTIPSALNAWKREQNKTVLSLFFVAWICLICSAVVKSSSHSADIHHEQHHVESHKLELKSTDELTSHQHSILSIILATFGGLGLMTAHLMNLKARREIHEQNCCHEHEA